MSDLGSFSIDGQRRAFKGNAIEVLSQFVHEAMSKQPLYHNSDEVRILIPIWFSKKLECELRGRYPMEPPPDVDRSLFVRNKFMGYELEIGYENKLVMYHFNYTLFSDNRLIHIEWLHNYIDVNPDIG